MVTCPRIRGLPGPPVRYTVIMKTGSTLLPDQMTADLGSIIAALETAGAPLDSGGIEKVARALAKLFSVDNDEVAVLKLVPKYRSLKFVIPEKLTPVGTIPLTSTTALAARTARENKAEIVNNFSTARHANVFEAVPLGRDPSEVIQKIMSAPIVDGTRVHGVVQVSRKARSAALAGADFTPRELRALSSLSPTLDRFLKLVQMD